LFTTKYVAQWLGLARQAEPRIISICADRRAACGREDRAKAE
jgi:hypothetical protein